MSGPKHSKALEGPEWLEELKTNKKTQAGLTVFVLALVFMGYMLWPDAPKQRPVKAFTAMTTAGDDHSLQALDKLPDLAKLGKAGELPGEDRMFRDLFTFDDPPPKPPPPPPPPPPPVPLTAEQMKAIALQQSKDSESASRPQGMRFLGYLERKSVGRIATFMKGELPVSIKQGECVDKRWQLITVTANYAEFQNLKYPELRSRIEAANATGGARSAGATNEF